MTRRKKTPQRKTRPPGHVTADLGVTHVRQIAIESGFSVEEFTRDYGTDLNVYIFDKHGVIENGDIRIQVRSKQRLETIHGGQAISCGVTVRHLNHWLNEISPFILVVYDANDETAYWLYVQRLFTNPDWKERLADATADDTKKDKEIKVHIPAENRLDQAAFLNFRLFVRRIHDQAWSVIDHGED